MPKEESQIKWEQFVLGNKEAYAWIYETYVQLLYRYGLRFTADAEFVKDAIQEVFTYIYKSREHLPVPENVKVYLLCSLKHQLMRSLREKATREYDDLQSLHFSMEPTIEEQLILEEQQAHQQEKINKLLAPLTPRQQEVIYYRFIQELDLNEIASLMEMNYQSVLNLIQRSLKKIRDACAFLPPK